MFNLRTHWLRGGFPRSYLAQDDSVSMLWRENFLNSFIERDIPAHGFNISSDGSEIDFILESGKTRVAIECKVSSSPRLGAGFYHGLELLKIDHTCVISPLIRSEEYTIKNNITICSIERFLTEKIKSYT